MQSAIKVTHLEKSFGDLRAVDDVSFDVSEGEIFSLLGPNGAGKTTTISMLAGLLAPDAGEIAIQGLSLKSGPQAAKEVLGVVPQDIALYEDLTAKENLAFWGKMYDLRGAELKRRVDEVLDLIGLKDRAKERVSKYSGGMKRRVNIGVALLHKPKVIYMDEPTVGIDPQSRRSILDGVKALRDAGTTVLYTTHYMEEAQELSNRIAIMDRGKIVAIGTHEELIKLVGELDRITVTINAESERVRDAWAAISGVQQIVAENGTIGLLVDDSNQILPNLFEAANAQDVRITSVDIQEPNLEAVFLHLTGRALRD